MRRFGAAIIVATSLLILYTLRLDEVAGLFVDDAYYIVLAEALASGNGYALISSATGPILPAFPPGFAMVLAPVVALSPWFPDNIAALKSISIVAMLAVAALTYRYFVAYRGLDHLRAATTAVITAALPAFVFLATSTVMAECVFTLAVLASAFAIEKASRSERVARHTFLAAVMSAAAWLIRSAGIVAVISGTLYLGWRRGWRNAAGFLAICAICYMPWLLYAGAHRPSIAEREAHGGAIVYSYRELLGMRHGGDPTEGSASVAEVFERAWKNVGYVFGRDLGALILPSAYRGAAESGQEVFQLSGESGLLSGSMGLGGGVLATSSLLSVIVMIGFAMTVWRRCGYAEVLSVLTVAMVILVPARTFRYLLPLAPFVLSYFFAGIEVIAVRLRGPHVAQPAFRIAALCVFILLGLEHAQYIERKLNGPSPDWIQDGADVRAVTDWINRELPQSGSVASTNPGLIYLRTRRSTVAWVNPLENWERWKASNVTHAAALHVGSKPGAMLDYRTLYESPRLKLWVLELGKLPLTESAR